MSTPANSNPIEDASAALLDANAKLAASNKELLTKVASLTAELNSVNVKLAMTNGESKGLDKLRRDTFVAAKSAHVFPNDVEAQTKLATYEGALETIQGLASDRITRELELQTVKQAANAASLIEPGTPVKGKTAASETPGFARAAYDDAMRKARTE
jgi:hypothetical protein